MGAETKIEWTNRRKPDGTIVAGKTFNSWMGCVKVSPACEHCYAERDTNRHGKVKWGTVAAGGTRTATGSDYWQQPTKWNRDAAMYGNRPMVFCASLADVFEVWHGPITDSIGNILLKHPDKPHMPFVPAPLLSAPNVGNPEWRETLDKNLSTPEFGRFREYVPVTMDDMRAKLFRVIASTPNLDWLILTKRPDEMNRQWNHLADVWYNQALKMPSIMVEPALGYYRMFENIPNVWAGTTVESQKYADERVPHLLKVRAARRFVSCEPMVGPVDFRRIKIPLEGESFETRDVLYHKDSLNKGKVSPAIDWVITGGESGPGARPAHPQWYRDLRDHCKEREVPFFFKQHGEWIAINDATPEMYKATTPHADTYPDGKERKTPAEREQVRLGNVPLPVLQYRVGKSTAGRLLDDVEHSEMPESAL